MTLEELEKAFQEQQREIREKQEIHKKKRQKLIFMLVAVVLVSVIIVTIIVESQGNQASEASNQTEEGQSEKVSPEAEDVPPFLNEGQQMEWTEKPVDDSQVYMQFSNKLEITAGQNILDLQLVNPPYSAYSIDVVIVMKDNPLDVLYQSELLKPGEYLETVGLTRPLEPGTYPILVQYQFYYEDGKTLMGSYEKEANIEVLP